MERRNTMYAVETIGLSKDYGGIRVVDEVSMQVEQGRIYGLVGKNGAGKTTLMRMILGLAAPTYGEVRLFGEGGAKSLLKNRRRISYLPMESRVYGNMNAAENLEIARLLNGIKDKKAVDESLETFGFKDKDRDGKKIDKFADGEKRKLALAMALMGNPELLMLDEPLSGVDPVEKTRFCEMIVNLAADRGLTVVISSHMLAELEMTADVYGFLHRGELIRQLTRDELIDESGNKAYIIVDSSHLRKAKGVISGFDIENCQFIEPNKISVRLMRDDPHILLKALTEAGVTVREFSAHKQGLEDYFTGLLKASDYSDGGRN